MARYLYTLPSVTITAGGTAVVQLNTLPKAVIGRIVHVRRFIFEANFTPTYTTAPTVVGDNNIVKNCDFYDGNIYRFNGGFNHLQFREKLTLGRVRLPEAQTNTASGTARYLRRVMYFGPATSANADSDYLIPAGMLLNGSLNIVFGALTDLSADTTAVTGTLTITADLELIDEIRIPPAVQFLNYSAGSADYQIPGRALYCNLALLNSSSFDAISAGDFGNITVDLGQGPIVPSIPTYALTAAWQDDLEANEVNTIQGEPRGSSDNNARQVDHASTTALKAADNTLQPVIWCKRNQKLTKLFLASTLGRVQWDGSQSTAYILLERILSQAGNQINAAASAALAAIGKAGKSPEVKTLSKDKYAGPYGEFLPWKVAV